MRSYLNKIIPLIHITLIGGARDRTFIGIGIFSIFLFISTPLFSSFSLRQVTAVAIDYNLTVTSFLGLLVVLFLGVQVIAKDIDRKSVYSIVSLPISRPQYIIGKYLGFASLTFIIIITLMVFSICAIAVTQHLYPQGVIINWLKIILAGLFIYIKLMIIVSVLFMFSAIGTSTTFPLAMGIAFYFVGESTEEVLLYLKSVGAEDISPFIRTSAIWISYIFPNLSSLDLKSTAIYNLDISLIDMVYVFSSAFSYIVIFLTISIIIFQKREFI